MAGGFPVLSATKEREKEKRYRSLQKTETSNMKANLKKTLPQEGTGYSLAGESLGGPLGSSCPTYSGGGQDRYRYRAPRNTETKKVSEMYLSSMQNSQGLNLTFNNDREVDDMVLALHDDKQKMGKLEDQTSSALEAHMLKAVMIVEKVASFAVGPRDQHTLNDAALKIKDFLMDIMNIESKQVETRTQLLALRREFIEKKAIVRDRLESTSGADDLENQIHSAVFSKKSSQRTEIEKEQNPFPSMAYGSKAKFVLNRSCVASEVIIPTTSAQHGDLTNEVVTYRTAEPQFSTNQGPREMVQALCVNNSEIEKVDPAAIKKKVTKEIKENLENTMIDIKDTLDELQKLSDSATKSRQVKKTTLIEIDKGLPELTTPTESLAPHISIDDQLDSKRMTSFLEKYLQNTIQKCDSRKYKSQQDRNVETNDCLTSTKTYKGDKRSNELRTPSPNAEPVHDLWYVEDRFKKLALKRVERNEDENAGPSECSESDEDTEDDGKVKSSCGAVYPRETPFWWSAEIAELRRVCLAARRQYARSRRRKLQRDEAAEAQLYVVFRAHQKTLNAAIKRAKAKGKPEAFGSS